MTEFESIFGNQYRIEKGQEFFKKFGQYVTDETNSDFWTFFNLKYFRLTEKTFSYRIISHWEKVGILSNVREEDSTGWRKYSVMDLVWLGVIKQLRMYGLGLKEILSVRRSLIVGMNKVEYGELEFYTALAYVNNTPVSVLVFSDYKAEVGNAYEILDSEIKYGPQHHISINVNGILQSIFPDKDCKPVYTKYIEITDDQNEILETIRNEKVEGIKISVKEGKPVKMKYTVSEPTNSNIGQLKTKNAYQKVSIEQHEGKTTSVKRKIKKKFK